MKITAALLATAVLAAAAGYYRGGHGAAAPPADAAEASATGSEDACDQPVLMVVRGTISDNVAMREYGQALQSSGLYPATSGYYLHIGGPVDVFEGDYPDNGFTVIARFPCLAHAQAFWWSETYREIVALREGAAEVLVTVYSELEPPDFMEGRLEGGRYVEVPPVDGLR